MGLRKEQKQKNVQLRSDLTLRSRARACPRPASPQEEGNDGYADLIDEAIDDEFQVRVCLCVCVSEKIHACVCSLVR